MRIRNITLYRLLLILFSLSITSCGLKHLGPEVRPDGVYFTFHAPAAKRVVIAGSFNQWGVHKNVLAGPDNDGVWSIILLLPPGRYEYLFFVDGKDWKLDPGTPWVDDGFGNKNSIIVIEK